MLPHLGKVVDDICLVRSIHTDQFNHAPAQIFFNTGFSQPGRPSLGSWALYGLGAETQNLPAFVVISTGSGLSGSSALWSFTKRIISATTFRTLAESPGRGPNPPDAGIASHCTPMIVRIFR
jgi:hypothetical protein